MRAKSARELAQPSATMYAAHRAYVAMMFDLMPRLLVAASESDAEVQREIQGFPEGLSIGFSVWGDPGLRFCIGVRSGRFVRLAGAPKPELEVVFKHVSHAFYVLTFKEGTAQAYARERMLTHGETSLVLRFVRCLNRMQAVALPRFVAKRALKAFPDITAPELRDLTKNLYGRLVRGLVSRSPV